MFWIHRRQRAADSLNVELSCPCRMADAMPTQERIDRSRDATQILVQPELVELLLRSSAAKQRHDEYSPLPREAPAGVQEVRASPVV